MRLPAAWVNVEAAVIRLFQISRQVRVKESTQTSAETMANIEDEGQQNEIQEHLNAKSI
jgi:hypothetical protein